MSYGRFGTPGVACLLLLFTGCNEGNKGQPAHAPGHAPVPLGAEHQKAAGTSQPTPNTEQYADIVENRFVSASQNPLSTFSAEVNTASYSNVRRFLIGGQKPPKDAVRIAELVNYFRYDDPRPTGDDPVSLTVDIADCPWQPNHRLVRVGVRAAETDPETVPPRNFVFLIDTSGSMTGSNRMGLVKRALNLLVTQLRPQDVVSVVTYAGSAGLVLPPTRGSEAGKIQRVVNGLTTGGGTNGGGGIEMAYAQAQAAFIDGGVNRVILCTDGDFNLGISNPGDLRRLVEAKRQTRVFLTVLGFGIGNLKNTTLETLANHGNGSYAYIHSEAEARRVFVEQAGALVTVAKDVKFQVDFNPSVVQSYRLLGFENRLLAARDFRDDAKDAADIGAGQTVTALYEVVPVGAHAEDVGDVDPSKYTKARVKPTPDARHEWLTVRMRYKHPESDTSLEVRKALPGVALTKPMSDDFRFAAAVAEFGLVLHDSEFRGRANLDQVLTTAENALGADVGGHRAEFCDLVRRAKQLRTQD